MTLSLPSNAISIAVGKRQMYGSNHQELAGLKREIFGESRYYVDIDKTNPRIIDGGAHVGLATLYYKSMWPNAHITCIEPLPENVHYLEYNLWENHFDDVAIVPAALAEQTGERWLYFDITQDKWFSTASFHEGAWNHDQQSSSTRVATIPLKSVLTEPTDIVKLDIEGAEASVLAATGDSLHLIHHLLIEYHPHPQNSWQKLTATLNSHGFISEEPLPTKTPTWLRNYHFINQNFKH